VSRADHIRVVDTNVLLFADRMSTAETSPVDDECITACVKALHEITLRGRLALDQSRLILEEYGKKLPHPKQPSVGSEFFLWVQRHQAQPTHCVTVPISPSGSDPTSFAEFPDHPELTRFDRDDRKFVAVAAAHPARPPILQAADGKWWGWRQALNDCGVAVVFLCEPLVRPEQKRKRTQGRASPRRHRRRRRGKHR
jgi:hypothetical protein